MLRPILQPAGEPDGSRQTAVAARSPAVRRGHRYGRLPGRPRILTLSGVGDLVAKFTAVRDWKLASRRTGEPLNDFAALLSDGSIHSYLSHPRFDLDGI